MEARPQAAPARATNGAAEMNHPIVDILGRADYEEFRERLAEDVIFHSPVAHFQFRGRDITSAQFERLVKVSDLDHWQVKGFTELTADAHVVALSTVVRGSKLDLLTVTKLNERYQIREMWAYARPMASIAIFPAFVYPHLVKLFGDRTRGRRIELMFQPLPRLLKFLTEAGLGYGKPPECEFEANLPGGERSPAAPAALEAPSEPAAPAGPRSPFRRL